jgi:hypothetical protein
MQRRDKRSPPCKAIQTVFGTNRSQEATKGSEGGDQPTENADHRANGGDGDSAERGDLRAGRRKVI